MKIHFDGMLSLYDSQAWADTSTRWSLITFHCKYLQFPFLRCMSIDKCKFTLVLEYHHHEGIWGHGDKTPYILKFNARENTYSSHFASLQRCMKCSGWIPEPFWTWRSKRKNPLLLYWELNTSILICRLSW